MAFLSRGSKGKNFGGALDLDELSRDEGALGGGDHLDAELGGEAGADVREETDDGGEVVRDGGHLEAHDALDHVGDVFSNDESARRNVEHVRKNGAESWNMKSGG